MERKVLVEHYAEFKSLEMKTMKMIKMLREENLELSSQVDHLSEQVERSKKIKEKL